MPKTLFSIINAYSFGCKIPYETGPWFIISITTIVIYGFKKLSFTAEVIVTVVVGCYQCPITTPYYCMETKIFSKDKLC